MIVPLFGLWSKPAYMWLLANKDSQALAYHKETDILDADEPKKPNAKVMVILYTWLRNTLRAKEC